MLARHRRVVEPLAELVELPRGRPGSEAPGHLRGQPDGGRLDRPRRLEHTLVAGLARALSHQPEILCLDEFSIAIDPVTTMRIEDVLKELRKEITIILVTNLVQQARRLADRTMFLWNGEIIELDRNAIIFSDKPRDKRTCEYVNGIFG